MTTPTPTYRVDPDHDGDLTLWRSEGEDPYAHAVAAKWQLDRLDPVLWPTLVAGLVKPDGDRPDTDTQRVWLGDNGNLYRWRGSVWEALAVKEGMWLPSVFDGPGDMATSGYALVEVPAVERICAETTGSRP